MHDLFPEVNWPQSSFSQSNNIIIIAHLLCPFFLILFILETQLNSGWQNAESRRNFFIEYASKRGFDPFNSENWLGQRMMVKVSKVLLFLLYFDAVVLYLLLLLLVWSKCNIFSWQQCIQCSERIVSRN